MGGGAGCTPPNKLGVVFVVDDSGSNLDNDPNELRRDAALAGVSSLPDGSLMSVSTFSGTATTPVPMTELTAANRGQLLAGVRDMPLTEEFNGTNYEAAFQDALGKLGQMSAADKRVVIFLTDGEPTEPFSSNSQIAATGVPIFSLGYGSSDHSVLAGISSPNGGKLYSLKTSADARSAFADIIDTLTCRSVFDPTDPRIPGGKTYERTFQVGTMTNYFRATVSWSTGARPASIEFVRPDGSAFPVSGPARGNEALVEGPGSVQLTVDNPVVGNWKVRVKGDPNRPVKVEVDAATAADTNPGKCPSGVQGDQKVTIGEAVAYGCFQKDDQGRYVTPYPARIGGFDADPDNDNNTGAPNLLILDTANRRIDIRGPVKLGLGGAILPGDPRVLPIGRKSFEFTLDKKVQCKKGCQLGKNPIGELEQTDVSLWGFDVAGTVKASWVSDGNGGAELEFAPSLDSILSPLLEKIFKTKEPFIEAGGSGGSLVKAGLKVRSTNDKGFELGLSELTINPFKLVDKPTRGGRTTTRWSWPVGISARGENKEYGSTKGYLWTFEVILGFPRDEGMRVEGKRGRQDIPDYGASGRVYVFDGSLAGGGAGVSGLNVPIGSSGVFLQRVALDILFRPGFGLRGEVGLSGGPKVAGEALVEGDPIAFGVGTLAKCQTQASNENLPFEVSGTLKVLPATTEVLRAQIELSGKVCYIAGDNALEAEGGFKALWLGGSLGAQGTVKGWVDDSKFNIEGNASIVLPGLPDPKGSLVGSSVGIAGCGQVAFFSGGFGWRYSGDPELFRGCDLGRWKQPRPASAASAAIVRAAQQNAFTIRRGVKFVGFRVSGAGGAPVVRVTGPGGQVYDSPAGAEGTATNRYVTTRVDELGQAFVVINRPRPGRWSVTQLGGAPIADIDTSLPVRRPRVRGRVAGGGARRTLRYRVRGISGQRIVFLERAQGVAHRIGVARKKSGRIRFRPARRGGSRRTIVAQVSQDGMPRANVRVDRFKAPTVGRRPGSVRISAGRSGRASVVRWTKACRAARYYVTVRYRGRAMRRGFFAHRRSLRLGQLRRGARVRVTVQAASFSRWLGRPATRTFRVGRAGRLMGAGASRRPPTARPSDGSRRALGACLDCPNRPPPPPC
jgi:hypothetical protein